MRGRPTIDDVRAARWTLRSARSVHRQLATGTVEAVRVDPPPTLPARSARAVHRVLRARRTTCLERALVLQAWFAARGRPRQVVIGVTGPRAFAAHAWLDGDVQCHAAAFHEIHRIPAR